MSVKTIYKCDKCGNEQYTLEQFWKVGVITHLRSRLAEQDFVEDKSMEVCRPCLESFGILVKTKPDALDRPSPPTIEELIREIISRCSG